MELLVRLTPTSETFGALLDAMRDNRRRLLFLIPSLRGGGSERVMVSLLRHLNRAMFQMTLAVVDMRNAVYSSDVPKDVELIDLRCSRVRLAIPWIARLIWQRKPDVVFSTLGHLNLAVAILRPALPTGVRFIARESIVVSLLPVAYRIPRWWRLAYRMFYGRFDLIVCQSMDMRDDLIENFGMPAGKTVVINNPVDVALVRRLARNPILNGIVTRRQNGRNQIGLVAVGRLTAQKGFDLLIEALRLCKDLPLHLTLLGEGPMRGDLEQMTIEKGLKDRVQFVGYQANPYPFLRQADALVLSSRFEGFPNVVLEALACGTPVIATPAPGGVREILDGLEGCVLAENVSAESLADALASFKGGYRMPPTAVARYDVKAVVRRYERVFLE